MLDKQIHMYALDTGHFYSGHERYLHNMNCRYRKERNYLNNQLPQLEKELREHGFSAEQIRAFKKGSPDCPDCSASDAELVGRYIRVNELIRHKRQKANDSKQQLLDLLAHKVAQNEKTDGKDHIRTLHEEDLHDNNVISSFESSLTRAIGIGQDELTEDLFTIQVYYFDVFKDISFYGFMYKGERYKYFTSSAGQIRKKKAVFIKESTWNRIEKNIMCGLTIDKINSKGGNNANKHLAYMALSNSATDVWDRFDVDKSIVVEDFETDVFGTIDFIDETDYSITRKDDFVPVPHTDGGGMMLPCVMDKNTMFRAPWIKGMLGVFDFRKMVQEKHYSPVILDIYGTPHDIFEEDIEIIFTKSQFKMYKYYDSWDEYKEAYKKYGCQAGICNTEEERIKNARINYQMLQTLTDVTDEEIDKIAAKSVEKITNICKSPESMQEALGITPYNQNMTPFQKAVKLYPQLLSDTYTKDMLREMKNSLLKKYRAGKLEVNGKYTFVLPDYYAACQFWFGGIKEPEGLLKDGEVYCRLFRGYEKVDCLRSPHLYKEHAVRRNVANEGVYGERSREIGKYFTTNGIYTSTHDLISKILMFDVDGDRVLVVADATLISVAERNTKDIVPLYYNMRKAEPTILNNKTIYEGLNAAFVGGNIGIYSNNISKIWNSDVFVSGTEEEKQHAMDCVKRLCCQNNFVIDYAKTLYKPEFPKEISEEIKVFTSKKLPAFFEFAKDKTKSQIEERNGSLVNKLYDKIPNKPIRTRGMDLGRLDHGMLMQNPEIRCSREVAELYDTLNKEYRYKINMKDEYADNLHYVASSIREEFAQLGYSEDTISDMLVQYLYVNEKRAKQLLWFCYGQNIVANLERNVGVKKTKFIQCMDCGEWAEVNVLSRACRCPKCQKEYRRVYLREKKRESRRRQQNVDK